MENFISDKMSKQILQIDASNSKDNNDEDLINIRFKNSDVVQANFTKLFIQSKYLRDKYIYSEGLKSIQSEIDDFMNKMNISDESIKCFIQLVEDEKVDIPIERYKDIYTLCEYFCIPKFTRVLDNIRCEILFRDLNFSIQILIDYETADNCIESKLMIEIENFLRGRINECIQNPKFGELQVSTIYRIFKSKKELIDQNLLVDFIFESISTRFILFKFVEVDKLKEDKLYEIISKLDSKEESKQEIYLEYIPFNLSLIKTMKNKYDQVLKENSELKEKLSENKKEQERMNEELKSAKEELKRREIKEEKMTKEISECQRELKQTKVELTGAKSENNECTKSIIVSGFVSDYRLGEKPNNQKNSSQVISPPVKFSLDPSSLLSYSVCCHTVLVMSDGSLKGVGSNTNGRISTTLQKTEIDHFTDFCIKDESGCKLTAVSAVCSLYGTLYMFSKSSGSGQQLVLCDYEINDCNPVFLKIGDHHPMSLFGGYYHSAAICSNGEVILINHYSIKNSPSSPIPAVYLPEGEKASSVACCNDSVVVLSSNGRVFSSPVNSNGVLKFSEVSELSGQEIVCVSGTERHFLAVSKEGRVFGCGANSYGQLGLEKGRESVSTFTEIHSLAGYKIRAAYAGCNHSLFETREGKILSCGYNGYGQLLLSNGAGENVYSPSETTIAKGAVFCIAGSCTSTVFIGNGLPPNTPNKRICIL